MSGSGGYGVVSPLAAESLGGSGGGGGLRLGPGAQHAGAQMGVRLAAECPGRRRMRRNATMKHVLEILTLKMHRAMRARALVRVRVEVRVRVRPRVRVGVSQG